MLGYLGRIGCWRITRRRDHNHPMDFRSMSNIIITMIGMQDLKWAAKASSLIMIPLVTPALMWPLVPSYILVGGGGLLFTIRYKFQFLFVLMVGSKSFLVCN